MASNKLEYGKEQIVHFILMLRRAAFVVSILHAALGLVGCQSTLNDDIAQFNAAALSSLPTACSLVESANASFQTIAGTGTISKKDLGFANQAYAAASAICANPSAANAATSMGTLAEAYAAIVQAKRSR